MMLEPYMNDLLKKVDNRYLLVNIAAKRARAIAEEEGEQGIAFYDKPVKVALEEISRGVIVPRARKEGSAF